MQPPWAIVARHATPPGSRPAVEDAAILIPPAMARFCRSLFRTLLSNPAQFDKVDDKVNGAPSQLRQNENRGSWVAAACSIASSRLKWPRDTHRQIPPETLRFVVPGCRRGHARGRRNES